MKCSERLRIEAPGNRPASQRIWKPLQMPEHWSVPRRGRLLHRGHDRRETRDRAAAEVIAVGKAARQHDEIVAREAGFLVPDVVDWHAEFVAGRDGSPDHNWSRENG